MDTENHAEEASLRVTEWAEREGFSTGVTYQMIRENMIEVVPGIWPWRIPASTKTPRITARPKETLIHKYTGRRAYIMRVNRKHVYYSFDEENAPVRLGTHADFHRGESGRS